MDRILKSLVSDFLTSSNISSVDDDKDFEKFVNYTIITTEYNREFDIEIVSVGEGGDTGIDGLAIIANGVLIENIEDIDELIQTNGTLEIKYIFIQSKNSSSFDSSEMNNFVYGVKDFFSETPKLVRNENIKYLASISDYIFTQAKFFRKNPQCFLFYVTTGKWTGDINNLAIMTSGKYDLDQTNLFSQVEFFPVDANNISQIYRDTKNSISTTFTFTEKITLPDLPYISEAFYGIIPFSEFRKIVFDTNGNLLNIFDDNVRDFQGLNNPINKAIEETLISRLPELFTVLNNGVTIVASDLKSSGNKFTINDYQIVNGCQTSNVLAKNCDNKNLETIRIPLRLIITNNDDIKNSITVATNSQTTIKREQLQAMKEFQKNLEYFYNTIEGPGKLFYERRTRQYQAVSSIPKSKIITVQTQIKSFGSIFLDIPDLVTTYIGRVLTQYVENDNPRIFNLNHQLLPYYLSGLAIHRLESHFRLRELDPQYRKVRWFLLMIFGKISNDKYPLGYKENLLNSEKETKNYCDPIIDLLNNNRLSITTFQKSIDILNKSHFEINNRQYIKGSSSTQELLNEINPVFYQRSK